MGFCVKISKNEAAIKWEELYLHGLSDNFRGLLFNLDAECTPSE